MGWPLAFEELANFRRRDRPVFSRVKSGKGQRSKRRSDELQDKIVEGFEESSDFAVPTFCQGDPIPGIRFRIAFGNKLQRANWTSVKFYVPGGDPFDMGWTDPPLDFDEIGSGNGISRMKNALGEVSVIGEEKSPFGLKVKASDMEKRLYVGEKVAKGRAAFRIMKRRDHSARFVE